MTKMAFFAAVAVALMALSAAEGDNTLQLQCQRQLQESSLDACRQVVDHELAIQLPFFNPWPSLLRSPEWRAWVRVQCCQQLRDVSRECRGAAIHQIVRQYELQAVAPLGGGSYYLGEDIAPLGGESYYYPGEHEEQQGWPYYPSETYPQQKQGWEQQQQGSHRFGTEQHTARLRQLRVVARARQVAAQLLAMCRLEGIAFSTSHY